MTSQSGYATSRREARRRSRRRARFRVGTMTEMAGKDIRHYSSRGRMQMRDPQIRVRRNNGGHTPPTRAGIVPAGDDLGPRMYPFRVWKRDKRRTKRREKEDFTKR